MLNFKTLKIKDFYRDGSIVDKIKGAVHFVSEMTEDDFIDIYPTTNDANRTVILYYKGCELQIVDTFDTTGVTDNFFLESRIRNIWG